MSTLKIKNGDLDDKYLDVIGLGTEVSPHQSVAPDYRIPYAINQVFSDDAVTISVRDKAKSLIKFGVNSSIQNGTAETVWEVGGNEAYPTTNAIDIVVSTNAGDTQSVVIEGHTISGTDLTFVSQTVDLNGTTDVTLATPLYRANRIFNNDNTDFAGDVTVEDNGTSVHLKATGDSNQSLKCATSISQSDYWIVTGLDVSVKRSASAVVDFEFQVRDSGGVFRTRFFTSTNQSGRDINFDQPIIVKPNSDVRMLATSNTNTTNVSASIHGYLAVIV